MVGGIKEGWEVIEDAIRDTSSSPAYFLGNTIKGKAPLHLPRLLSIFLILIKIVIVDKKKLEKLRNFFQLTKWANAQGEIHEDDFTVLQSLSFIQSFLLYPCVTVAVHCMRRCRVERHMIECARFEKHDKDLQYDINNTFPRFVKYVEKFQFPTNPEEVTDGNWSLSIANWVQKCWLPFMLHFFVTS